MDPAHHDTAQNPGSFWNTFAQFLGIGLAAFSLIAGAAFIYGGMRYSRAHGPQPAPPPPPTAPAPAAAAPGAADVPAAAAGAPVDASKGEIVLKPGTDNPLTYDIKSFSVKAGQKLKVTFNNQSVLPQPHNFILGKLGSKDRLLAAVTAMVTDPNGFAKGFIPESPDVIVHTKLINAGQSETIEFTVPAEKGDYPYLCSFPGHAILMNGVMKVE